MALSNPAGEITKLIRLANEGEAEAEERLFRLVYSQLKSLASGKLGGTGRRTLTPTALVHESYLRVFRQGGLPLQNRRHFFFAYGQAMYRIVAEHYRKKHGRCIGADPGDLAAPLPSSIEQLLDLDEALMELKRDHPREYEIAILRKALGFGIDRTANLLALSPATVKRGWAFAKAKLSLHLREEHDVESPTSRRD